MSGRLGYRGGNMSGHSAASRGAARGHSAPNTAGTVRLRRIRALSMGTLLLLIVVAAASWPAALRASVEPAPVIATMLSSEVSWRSQPTEAVRIELVDGGVVVASADGQTGPDGWLTSTLVGGPDPIVRPGRTIRAGPVEEPAVVEAVVPNLSVQLLQARHELAGDGPGGSTVQATLRARGQVTTTTATIGVTGRYTVSLPAGFHVADGVVGYVELEAGEARLRAAFEGLSATADLGGAPVWGRAPRGGDVQVLGKSPGSAASEIFRVEGTPLFSVTLRHDGAPYRLAPGDRVTVREDGRTTVEAEVPDLQLRADLTGAITGWSTPRSAVTIDARGPSGQASTTVHAGINGLFSASLGDDLLFEPGTVVSATTGPQVRFRKSVNVTGGQVRLNSATVTGVITPGVEVRASLLGLDGRLKGSGRTDADGDGRFSISILDRQDQPAAVREGEELVLGLGTGLPIRTTLPPLAAYASPLDDVVAGTTWPSLPLIIQGADAVRRVTSDAEGVFVADFRPDFGSALDIVPGDVGRVTYVYPHLVVRGNWVAPSVELTLFDSDMGAVGVPGFPLTITLRNGTSVVASAAGWASDTTGAFDSRLRAADGQPVTARAQDDLSFEAPRFHALVSLPELTVAANPVAGSIAGHAPPGAAVRLARGDGTALATASADASGAYSAAVQPLEIGESIGAEVVVRELVRIRRFEPVRRAVVNLDTSHLNGWGMPATPIRASLSRSGVEVGDAEATADGAGAYSTTLEGPSGGAVAITAGSSLVIEDGGPDPITVTAPGVALDLDEANLMVDVTGPPNAPVLARFTPTWGLRAGREVQVAGTTDAAGRWRAGFPPGLDSDDGPLVEVEVDHGGVTWARSVGQPYLDAQVAGVLVRGRTVPGQDVVLTALRAGSQIGTATSLADARGAYTAVLQTALGVTLAPGDQVSVDGGPGSAVRALTLAVDQAAGTASGAAGAGEDIELTFSAAGGDPLGSHRVTANAAGEYNSQVSSPAPLAPGIAAEAAVSGTPGRRTFALDNVPQLIVRIGSAVVRGLGDPFGAVAIDVIDGTGQAAAMSRADTLGRWEAVLEGTGGPLRIEQGARVHYAPEGGAEVVLDVPAFGVRLMDKGVVTGWAPPSAEVNVRLTGSGGASFQAHTRAFLDGTWVIRESELPGAPPYPLTQTVAAYAWLDVDGHRVEAHSGDEPAPTPTPTNRPLPGSPTATRTAGSTPTATATSGTRTPTATRTATTDRPGSASLFMPLVRSP